MQRKQVFEEDDLQQENHFERKFEINKKRSIHTMKVSKDRNEKEDDNE